MLHRGSHIIEDVGLKLECFTPFRFSNINHSCWYWSIPTRVGKSLHLYLIIFRAESRIVSIPHILTNYATLCTKYYKIETEILEFDFHPSPNISTKFTSHELAGVSSFQTSWFLSILLEHCAERCPKFLPKINRMISRSYTCSTAFSRVWPCSPSNSLLLRYWKMLFVSI